MSGGPLGCRLANCFSVGGGVFRFLVSVGDCGEVSGNSVRIGEGKGEMGRKSRALATAGSLVGRREFLAKKWQGKWQKLARGVTGEMGGS